MDRRKFLQAGAAGLALSAVGPNSVVFANEKPKRVALIGCGWYGKAALLRLIQVEPVEVVALCDVDSRMLAEAAEIVSGRQVSGKKPRTYGDFRQMLKKEQLDIVQVSTPDHTENPGSIPTPKTSETSFVFAKWWAKSSICV